MPTPIKMPALSPTMEEGTLAKWLVKAGDTVSAGDLLAEIETDKATMEFEAVDEGTIASIEVDEGTEGVAVGTVIAMLAGEGESVEDAAKAAPDQAADKQTESKPANQEDPAKEPAKAQPRESAEPQSSGTQSSGTKSSAAKSSDTKSAVPEGGKAGPAPTDESGERIFASPLARRIADQKGLDLAGVKGSGPRGRIVKADVENAEAGRPASEAKPGAVAGPVDAGLDGDAPFAEEKLSNVRKVVAKRLTEAKQEVPHYYLSVDIRLDALLAARADLNKMLEADGVKLSVNDILIKALAKALMRTPQAHVSFQGDVLHRYNRADISVAVASPKGLITPIIRGADRKSLPEIATEMKELAGKAREGKLQPHEYQGGTASISNLGMFGIKQFDAVINPPQGMIMAVGAGEQRPYVVDGEIKPATVMTASGSFDHRAIDGAEGAQLMEAFKKMCEQPMGMML
ncbi:pyruvate dehydrogenase complex dihydrolipoamide acetyltransferase [Alteriqipengyuania lutimaris]|uniref:Acetyltransferase component of pyruvate dehydrogenase complex n=1 Tax=Alteriqipengyuania lutimaris TaxID=1538146 RepID=A0A395LLX0_9SPHN|nr:pyruvate dehydrogenase complex dihydrolipoamide acetyltransferase [Alteriqipengyuania lutimaris]MBB3032875.1 pyruvate dehydrogenase E2 component (dihydrolipoamide acetyltransferase) [Alteriqipengyuania lutimaris]RDS78036.1 pyruvate dehydrogenase complex dihydrolipoamide acetyltransferase [Alteriqipengyuania lutimaris]